MSIIFSQGSGVADSVFGKSQAPIKAMIESGVEAFQQFSAVQSFFLIFHIGIAGALQGFHGARVNALQEQDLDFVFFQGQCVHFYAPLSAQAPSAG